MQISIEREKDFLRVAISGEIDMSVAERLRSRIDDELDKACVRNIVFDFSRVSFIDSSGLGVIVGRYRRILPLGGFIAIFGANERVYRILELSGITRIMRVQKTQRKRGLVNE